MPKRPILIQMSARLLLKPNPGIINQSLTPSNINLSTKLLKAPAKKTIEKGLEKEPLNNKTDTNNTNTIKRKFGNDSNKPKLIPGFI